MQDLAWMVRESTSAWLRGYGDRRFDQYENFYRKALTTPEERADLEIINEEYARWSPGRPGKFICLLNHPIVARATISLVAMWVAAQAVPHAAALAPKPTAGLLVAAFIGLRISHRKRRRSQ
jgi:hypothetical protein